MSDVTATDFVGDGGTALVGAGRPLFLDDDHYSITW